MPFAGTPAIAAQATAPIAPRTGDERRMAPALTYPWNTLGRIEYRGKDRKTGKLVSVPGPLTCTGTLVGEDLVITTASCVVSTERSSAGTPYAEAYYFRPQFLIEPVRVKEYHLGTDFKDGVQHENDYAILRLEGKVGKSWRLPPALDLDDSTAKELTFFAAAMSRDRLDGQKPSFDKDCRIVESGSVLRSNCFVNPLSLGGPLFFVPPEGDAFVIGLHAASEPPHPETGTGSTAFHVRTKQFLRSISKAHEGTLDMRPLP